jgi:hypothetical protein
MYVTVTLPFSSCRSATSPFIIPYQHFQSEAFHLPHLIAKLFHLFLLSLNYNENKQNKTISHKPRPYKSMTLNIVAIRFNFPLPINHLPFSTRASILCPPPLPLALKGNAFNQDCPSTSRNEEAAHINHPLVPFT